MLGSPRHKGPWLLLVHTKSGAAATGLNVVVLRLRSDASWPDELIVSGCHRISGRYAPVEDRGTDFLFCLVLD